MFDTQYRSHVRVHCSAGDPIRVTFEPFYNDHGVLDLKESGKVNQYLEIQSHADSVDINLLLSRFNSGETDVLNQVQGFYSDVSGMPKSYADLLNTMIAGENSFMKLPLDVRAKFNHSFAQFISEFGTPSFEEKLNYKAKEVNIDQVNSIQSGVVPEPVMEVTNES